jgi:hypothetical protein
VKDRSRRFQPAAPCYTRRVSYALRFSAQGYANEDAIREYERRENQRIKRWLKRLALFVPLIVFLAWLLLHLR